MSTRYKAIISYSGINFYGYQIQLDKSLRSVEGEIEKVLNKIFSKEIKTYASGRTDKGVHALGQVIHFDLDNEVSTYRLRYSLNSLLPSDIHVESLEIVNNEFHSRYSAISKEYRYIVSLNERSPFNVGYVYNLKKPLDMDKVNEAMKLFIGTHSFHNFCSNDEDFIRTIISFKVKEENNQIIFDIKGNGFRRYMVRMIIGTIIEVGLNKLDVNRIIDYLDESNHNRVRYKAPSEGLYLVKVNYKGGEEDD